MYGNREKRSIPNARVVMTKTNIFLVFIMSVYRLLAQDTRTDLDNSNAIQQLVANVLYAVYEPDMETNQWQKKYYGREYSPTSFSERHSVEITYQGSNLDRLDVPPSAYEALGWHRIDDLHFVELLHCSVSPQLLTYISKLDKLNTLVIGREIEEIEIDGSVLACLSQMKNLRQLHLLNKGFTATDLEFLKDLQSLETFQFRWGKVNDSTLRSLLSLDRLKHLECGDLADLSPETLMQLSIEENLVSLSFNSITQLEQILLSISKLSNLEKLEIDRVDHSKVNAATFQVLRSLGRLEELRLQGDLGALPTSLPQLSTLKKLTIDYSFKSRTEAEPVDVNPSFLLRTPNLEQLFLHVALNRLSGETMVRAISNCKSLKSIYITGHISETDARVIVRHCEENEITLRGSLVSTSNGN